MNETSRSDKLLISYASWLEKVNEYIHANLGNRNLTVADIADAVFMSERQFYRRIKKITGKTPNQYLKELRLEKAKNILEDGIFTTVKEVAYSVGYSRSDYFSSLFESHFGIKPTTFFQA